MKKKSVIKSARVLKMVTNLYAGKLRNAVGFYGNAHVDVEEYLQGRINHIVIWFEHDMLFMAGIDSVREITDCMEAKYDMGCVCTSIQTRPYLASDDKTWLHRPVIEVMLRVKE